MSQTKTTDMTPVINLTRVSGTGPKRSQRPVYKDHLPPCNSACPAGENIQAWMAHVQAGQYLAAWEALVRDNPMPAVHGRVCYHPCESHCNREELDSAVSIHAVERFLGDLALESGWTLPIDTAPSGKRVLIIGAGPCGLSAAYHLTRLGHVVEIHDAGELPGGMLHFGIPAYRMPRDILMREITRIEQLGVKIVLNHRVEDVLAEKQAGLFDAVLVATGAQLSRHVDIPERDAAKVLDAVSLLKNAETRGTTLLGRRVVVYGGGNTAMDAARTARRLGATDTLIVYRRDNPFPSHHGAQPQGDGHGHLYPGRNEFGAGVQYVAEILQGAGIRVTEHRAIFLQFTHRLGHQEHVIAHIGGGGGGHMRDRAGRLHLQLNIRRYRGKIGE